MEATKNQCFLCFSLPFFSVIVNVASLESVLPKELLATQRYFSGFSVVSLKATTREEIPPFVITVPRVTRELFFNQPITGRGKPFASQSSVTVATPSSRYRELLLGWIEKTGPHKTERKKQIRIKNNKCRMDEWMNKKWNRGNSLLENGSRI